MVWLKVPCVLRGVHRDVWYDQKFLVKLKAYIEAYIEADIEAYGLTKSSL